MKSIRLLVLFIISLLITACASTTTHKLPIVQHESTHQIFNEIVSKKAYVDSKFNEDEKEAITKAAQAWEHDTNGIIHFDLVFNFNMADRDSDADPTKYTGKLIIKKVLSKEKVVINMDNELNQQINNPLVRTMMLGYYLKQDPFEIIYIVADRLANKDGFVIFPYYQNVVMHEMGHELGLQHFDEESSIMNSKYEFTEETLIGVKRTPLTCITIHDAYKFCHLYQCNFLTINHC